MNKLIEEFESLKTDEEKWKWVKNHQTDGIIVNCDNDVTFITINGDENGENARFVYYIGCAEGILPLFKVLGINAEFV